jgi:hypothetical protein
LQDLLEMCPGFDVCKRVTTVVKFVGKSKQQLFQISSTGMMIAVKQTALSKKE